MSLKILLVTATMAEADCMKMIPGIKSTADKFYFEKHEIIPLVTGVGSIATAWTMTKWISSYTKPDIAVNIGIAGSYRNDLPVGEAVVPVSDCFADVGIDTGKGFLTLAEAGLEDPDKFPFSGGKIIADSKYVAGAVELLKPVRAITVNTATGSAETIKRLIEKYNPDIETMEGATFFYICTRENIPFLALRSVSNRVEPRNKENWNVRLALETLSKHMEELLILFE